MKSVSVAVVVVAVLVVTVTVVVDTVTVEVVSVMRHCWQRIGHVARIRPSTNGIVQNDASPLHDAGSSALSQTGPPYVVVVSVAVILVAVTVVEVAVAVVVEVVGTTSLAQA